MKFIHIIAKLQKVRSAAPTEDEYRTLLTVSERAGVVRKEERYMVNQILALEKMQVKEIMTPRVDMQCVEDALSPQDMAEALRRIKHRRVPIIHETPDTIEGILKVKDFLADPARELDEVEHLVIVLALHEDHVEFHLRESRLDGGVNPRLRISEVAVAAQLAVPGSVERVEGDIDLVDAAGAELVGEGSEQGGIGAQADVGDAGRASRGFSGYWGVIGAWR